MHESAPTARSDDGRYVIIAGRRWRATDPAIPDATICPSDAARVVGGPSWRELMDSARSVAGELSQAGVVVVRRA